MTKLNLKNIIYITVFLTFGFLFIANKFPESSILGYSLVSFLIFTILYFLNLLYEKYFWKGKWFKKVFILIGFQEYPNIVGEWKMEYFSSYKYDWDNPKYNTKGVGGISIKKIEGGFMYSGNFDQSKFKSSLNYFEKNKNNKMEWSLGYKYTNNPTETDLVNGFVGHCGCAILDFDENKPNEIIGFYGNDENRKTRGKIILIKT